MPAKRECKNLFSTFIAKVNYNYKACLCILICTLQILTMSPTIGCVEKDDFIL